MSQLPIDLMLSRRSIKFVQAPGPDDTQLSLILQAAMRAPDHGRLRPWRFKILRPQAIQLLLAHVLSTLKEEGTPMAPEKEAVARRWLDQVPLLLAVACHLDFSNERIPEEERVLATGAAVMQVLNASHMLGFGAYWSTGLGSYHDAVAEYLGFDTLEHRFLGYVSIGSPIQSPPALVRPDPADFVSEWTGPAA